jgi:hypothetical protein
MRQYMYSYTRGSWVASFTLRRLYSGERALYTNWIGGCVGPIVGLDAVKKKISLTKITCWTNAWYAAERNTSKARDTLSSRHVSSRDVRIGCPLPKMRFLWSVTVLISGAAWWRGVQVPGVLRTYLLHHQDHLPYDIVSSFFWNFGTHLPDYTVSRLKTRLLLFNL